MNGVRRVTEHAPRTLFRDRACSKERSSLLHVWQGRGVLRADRLPRDVNGLFSDLNNGRIHTTFASAFAKEASFLILLLTALMSWQLESSHSSVISRQASKRIVFS